MVGYQKNDGFLDNPNLRACTGRDFGKNFWAVRHTDSRSQQNPVRHFALLFKRTHVMQIEICCPYSVSRNYSNVLSRCLTQQSCKISPKMLMLTASCEYIVDLAAIFFKALWECTTLSR